MCMATHPVRKGPNEVMSCRTLRPPSACANAAAARRTSASELDGATAPGRAEGTRSWPVTPPEVDATVIQITMAAAPGGCYAEHPLLSGSMSLLCPTADIAIDSRDQRAPCQVPSQTK